MSAHPTSASRRVRKRPRLAAAVVEDLVTAIVTEIYPAGSALPPESTLGEIYDVSRTVVREATMALTEKGLVVSQQGRGTIVRDASAWDLLDPMILEALIRRDDGLSYLDNLLEIRSLIESAMAAKAASKATPDDLAELTAQINKLEGLLSVPAAYLHEDVAFHDVIRRISGDRLSKAIIDGVQSEALRTQGHSGRMTIEHVKATHETHKKIHAAIAARDPEAAGRAMREHIESIWAARRAAAPAAG